MTTDTDRTRTGVRTRVLTALLATISLLAPTAATADPPDRTGVVDRAPFLSAWIFFDGDLLVLTGPPQDEETCLGLATQGFDWEGFSTPVAPTVTTPRGHQLTNLTHEDRVWVYDAEGVSDPLEWLFGGCAAMLGDGAPAPVPLAHGDGLVRVHARTDADGVERGHGGVTARVTTADGRQVHLSARGDDATFEGDVIVYGG